MSVYSVLFLLPKQSVPREPMTCWARGARCFAPFRTLDHRTTKKTAKYDKVGQVWLAPLYVIGICLPRMRCRDSPAAVSLMRTGCTTNYGRVPHGSSCRHCN